MVAYVTQSIPEAQIIAGRLQHEDIPAVVDYMTGRDAIGLTVGLWGEVRVLVHPRDYDMAMAILFPDEPDELPERTQEDDVIYYDDWDADDDD
ncbi:MAG: putative signal transducing protein [Chloroflexota bacterium]